MTLAAAAPAARTPRGSFGAGGGPNVLIVSNGRDVAGCGAALQRAFASQGVAARAIRRADSPYGYPGDITWRPGADGTEARGLWDRADVIHVMDDWRALRWFPLRRQGVVVHHLGSRFRADPIGVNARCLEYGAVQVTDSFDLMLFPHIRWLPVTTDLATVAKARNLYVPGRRLRIAHAPTNRAFYSTDAILEAVGGLDVDFDLIEGVSNAECILRKAQADIFIDGLTFGYGMNPIECWAMGIPVVSGLVDPRGRAFMRETFGGFPFADATAATLRDILYDLVADEWRRSELGQLGRAHVEKWHSEAAVVRQTLAVYEQTVAVAA